VGSACVLGLWIGLRGGRESFSFFPSVLSELMMPISHQHGKLSSPTWQKILNFKPFAFQIPPAFNLHRLLVFQKDTLLRYLIFGETVEIVTFHGVLLLKQLWWIADLIIGRIITATLLSEFCFLLTFLLLNVLCSCSNTKSNNAEILIGIGFIWCDTQLTCALENRFVWEGNLLETLIFYFF